VRRPTQLLPTRPLAPTRTHSHARTSARPPTRPHARTRRDHPFSHLTAAHGGAEFHLSESVDFRLAKIWRKGAVCHPEISAATAARLRPVVVHAARNREPAAPRWALPSEEELAGRIARPLVPQRGMGVLARRQCPPHPTNPDGVRLRCPWYSPSCPEALKRQMFDIEYDVLSTMNSTTRLPTRRLHGGFAFNLLPNAPPSAEREALGRQGSQRGGKGGGKGGGGKGGGGKGGKGGGGKGRRGAPFNSRRAGRNATRLLNSRKGGAKARTRPTRPTRRETWKAPPPT